MSLSAYKIIKINGNKMNYLIKKIAFDKNLEKEASESSSNPSRRALMLSSTSLKKTP